MPRLDYLSFSAVSELDWSDQRGFPVGIVLGENPGKCLEDGSTSKCPIGPAAHGHKAG